MNLTKTHIKKKINLTDLAPEIKRESEREMYLSIRGGPITYYMPVWKPPSPSNEESNSAVKLHKQGLVVKKGTLKQSISNLKMEWSGEAKMFQCHMSEIVYFKKVQGYSLVFDVIKNWIHKDDSLIPNKQIFESQFEFKYGGDSKIYSEINDQSKSSFSIQRLSKDLQG